MPALLVLELSETPYHELIIKIPYEIVKNYYPSILTKKSKSRLYARIFIDKFYNKEGKIIKEIKKIYKLPVECVIQLSKFKINLNQFQIYEGIPIAYLVELILLNFIIISEEEKKIEILIYPNELKIFYDSSVPENIKNYINMEYNNKDQFSKELEVVSLLCKANFESIASDLLEALRRFYSIDSEGSIKFFRKIIEAIRNQMDNIENLKLSANRKKLLKEYVSKTYQLVSNFGEHAGTSGLIPEAIFTKNITLSLCKYIATYIIY